MALPTPDAIARAIRIARVVHAFAPRRTTAALAFMVAGTLSEGVSIVLLMPIITLIGHGPTHHVVTLPLGRYSGGLLPATLSLNLAVVLAAFIALVSLRAVLMRRKDIFTMALLQDFVNGMRARLFASIAQARWEAIARLRVSDLDHALTADMDRLQMAAMHLLALVQSVVLLGVYLSLSLLISPALTLFAGAIGAISLALLAPVRRTASAHGRTLTELRQAQFRIVAQFLGGMKVAKSFGVEPRFIADLEHALGGMRDATLRYMRVQTGGATAFQIVSAVALAAFVWLALEYLALSQAGIIVMIFLLMRLAPRFVALQATLQEVLVNAAAFDAMERLRAETDAAREPSGTAGDDRIALADAIRFERVSFHYGADETRPVLADMSFAIPARRVTALTGASGSGKSTVADLLLGLLEPVAGRILIDRRPLDDIDRATWRARIAYVPQDVLLMHDTIAANLAIARADATLAEMWAALEQANAAGFVRRLADGIDTIVGERGMRLSGGERQRISLARALLREPLLLILDEATSALDAENRDLIVQALEALRGRTTVLLIAHDEAVRGIADHVVALDAVAATPVLVAAR